MKTHQRGDAEAFLIFVLIAVGSVLVIGLLFFGLPMWNVWKSGLSGEAELKQAEWNRQIAIKEAEAKFHAASKLAEAEVERAKGVAAANKIIGDSLKDNEAYLRYLWVDSLHHTKDQIIYVPTEANLPILEAGRRHADIGAAAKK